MKISFRTIDGWSEVQNHNVMMSNGKFLCPYMSCGAKLYSAPHGGIYCDKVHKGIATVEPKYLDGFSISNKK